MIVIELCDACGTRPATMVDENKLRRTTRHLCDECRREIEGPKLVGAEPPAGAKILTLPVTPRADIDSIVDLPPIRVQEAWRDHLRDPEKCHHPSVLVREGLERGVECRTCKKELDAIAVLIQYADRDRRILDTLEGLRQAKKDAIEEAERIKKSSAALRRKRADDVAKHPILAVLVQLRGEVARRLRAHPDEDVARLRASIRHWLDEAIARAVRALEDA